jgi:adenylate cyclase
VRKGVCWGILVSSNGSRQRNGLPLALVLIATVSLLLVLVAGTVIAENYRRSVALAMEIGDEQFGSLRTEIAVQEQELVEPLATELSVLAAAPELGRGQADALASSFMRVLVANPQITEIRAAYDDGTAFAIANLPADGRLRSALAAPAEARFAERRVTTNGAIVTIAWAYLDEQGARLGDFANDLPAMKAAPPAWVVAAHAAGGEVVQTKADVIPSLHAAGPTYTAAFDGAKPGVIAADIAVSTLSHMLATLKSSDDDVLFLFDDAGHLVASPDSDPLVEADGALALAAADQLSAPAAKALLSRFRESGPFATADMVVAGAPFIGAVIRIGREDEPGPATYLALALPDVTFTGRFLSIGRESVAISLVILLASIPLVFVIARGLARPLSALQQVTDHIAKLDMSQPIAVPTRIREIAALAGSVAHMRNALGEIAKFVPKSLVQDLLSSGATLGVEGERRELTLMFSDVRGFTTLAESTPADALMAQMSAYFDALAGAVVAHRGTIDKYIGDAIFAFWNAPRLNESHATAACAAVIAARDASRALNAAWAARGLPAWETTFSLHCGEVVVGNVGTRDRLNYTAVGTAVNVAARLQGLNKVYGTEILVSEAIVTAADAAFAFRPLDLVLPKGALQPVRIYELSAEADQAKGRAWDQVWERYQARAWRAAYSAIVDFTERFPEDALGEVYRARISAFLASPPPASWDGVTRYETK